MTGPHMTTVRHPTDGRILIYLASGGVTFRDSEYRVRVLGPEQLRGESGRAYLAEVLRVAFWAASAEREPVPGQLELF